MGLSELGFIGFLLISTFWDLKTRKIPNLLCAAGFLISIALRVLEEGWIGSLHAVTDAAGMVAATLLLWGVRAIGAGDAKWFGVAGSFLGMYDASYLLLFSLLIGGLYSFIVWAVSPSFRLQMFRVVCAGYLALCSPTMKHLRNVRIVDSDRKTFPFMTAVAPGTVCLYWFIGGAL